MVFDPIVEESEDVVSVVVPCEDGEPVGVPFVLSTNVSSS